MVDPRSLTDDERDRLEPALSKTEIPVVVSAAMGSSVVLRLNGKATGWWRDTRRIVLAEQVFDQFDEEQLHALVAHQVGHHRGRHPLLLGVGKLIVFLLAGSIGSLLAGVTLTGPWSWAVYPIIIAVLVVVLISGGSVLLRRLEFAADRRGATLLGLTAPFRALLDPAVVDRDQPSGIARLVDYCYPWPTARQRLRALDSEM